MCQSPNFRPNARTPIAIPFRPSGKRSGAGTGRPKPSRFCTAVPFARIVSDQPPSTTKSVKPAAASGLAAKSAASAGSEVAFRACGS